MTDKDKAYEDWQKGMKYKEIAEKYGVSLSAVKSWAMRDWKKKKVATKDKKKLQPKSQPKLGAPYGNHNAKGNCGGAPLGNQNHFKHGIYSKVYWDTLDEDEHQLIENMNYEEEHLLEEQIALLTVREHRLLVSIKKYKDKGGLSADSVVKHTWFGNGGNEATSSDTTMVTTSFEILIQRLESELTKVQSRKTRCIEALNRLRIQRDRNDGGNDKELVDDWIAAVEEADNDGQDES